MLAVECVFYREEFILTGPELMMSTIKQPDTFTHSVLLDVLFYSV
jgi:hypothetical protein